MKIEDLTTQKKNLISELKIINIKISEEFKVKGISQHYLKLVKQKIIISDNLKVINNSIVKLVIVRDSFVFGSPI